LRNIHSARRYSSYSFGAHERFDLLEKIASAMAKAKGVKLPPKLTAVPS